MKKTWFGRLALCLMPILAVACGGGGGGGDSTHSSVAGVASKGPIRGGVVSVYALDGAGVKNATALGTATTADDGTYEVDLKGYKGSVLVEVIGGTYRDEATGEDKPNPGLKAALSGVSGPVTVAVTPLTDLAVQRASTPTKENIDKGNSLVSSMVGLDVVGVQPVDVTQEGAAATATQDQVDYGLALAALSSMSQGGSLGDTIAQLRDDLADDGMLQVTGGPLMSALDGFLASDRNKSGVSSSDAVPLGSAIAYIAAHAITPPAEVADVVKAKAMVSDFRNTILSIYNYNGVGAPGILETPLKNFSEELQYEVQPELAGAVDRIGWIVASTQYLDPFVSATFTQTQDGETLTIVVVAETSATFTITDGLGATLASGALAVAPNGDAMPVSGSLDAAFETPQGELVVTVDYAGTVNSDGVVTRVTLTGTMTAPGLEVNFKDGGRKLTASFAKRPGAVDPLDIYPTGALVSGFLKTRTGQVEGAFELSNFVLNVVSGDPLPKNGKISGSFQELVNGQPTGVKFEGSITGTWANAASYDMDAGDSATNFPRWDATFLGKIVAPSRPTIEASLKASQTAYQLVALEAKYTRTAVAGAVVFLSGTGTLNTDTGLLTAEFRNQAGYQIHLTFDDSLAREEQLSGTITTAGGAPLAELGSNMQGIPTVKYIDNYFESLI